MHNKYSGLFITTSQTLWMTQTFYSVLFSFKLYNVCVCFLMKDIRILIQAISHSGFVMSSVCDSVVVTVLLIAEVTHSVLIFSSTARRRVR